MKQKTSITLSSEVIRALDDLGGTNRSRLIEDAVVEYLDRHRAAQRDARDLEILNAVADDLNREMKDVLNYQADW